MDIPIEKLVKSWREHIFCSCSMKFPNKFGDCVGCDMALYIMGKRGSVSVKKFISHIRIGMSNRLNREAMKVPYTDRKVRVSLSQIAQGLKSDFLL